MKSWTLSLALASAGLLLTAIAITPAAMSAGKPPTPSAVLDARMPTPVVASPVVRGSAKVDSVVLARYDFDDDQGAADPQGWTAWDLTVGPNTGLFWHVDDFAGLAGYAPLAGTKSLWCGARTSPDDAVDGTWPGYGNSWRQSFESVPFAVTGDVHIGYAVRHDLEPSYDVAYLEYRGAGGEWAQLAMFTGTADGRGGSLIPPVQHGGTIAVRFRMQSDSGWSDEDGRLDTYGAIVIDDLTVSDDTGIVDHQDFEGESAGATGTADGHWTATVETPFGLHAGLVDGDGVLQEDPAVTNASNLWGFFLGSPDDYGCGGHPEQAAIPHDRDSGSRDPINYFSNEARSPWIALDRDETGGYLNAVPDTVQLEFQVYRDLAINRSIFYTYHYRFRTDTANSRWFNAGYVHHGTVKDWYAFSSRIAVPAGWREIQVGLATVDYAWVWPDYDACQSHAPLFDNVRLTAAGQVRTGFMDIGANLGSAGYGDVDWGDYDGDGDLDLLVVGASVAGKVARICRNDGTGFTDIGAALTGISHGSAQWGDYDNDGDLDLLLAGDTGDEAERAVTRLYRNDAGVFTALPLTAPGLLGDYADRSLAWGDYDNDGDLDFAIAGRGYPGYAYQYRFLVYRNDGGDVFTDAGAGLPAMANVALAWGDYDTDGDLDLLAAGSLTGGAAVTRIYRNGGEGQFTDIAAGLLATSDGSVAWGDYDNDGDPDIALTGFSPGISYASRIYRNDVGSFVNIGAALPNLGGSSVDWGDCDGDGDLDLLLAGWDGAVRHARVYRNTAGTFVDSGAELAGAIYGSAGWGDFDSDGDLDVALAGYNTTDGYFTRIYRNLATAANTPPDAPATGLISLAAGNQAALHWDAASDAQTPAAGLSYNLRIGTTPGGIDVCGPMADPVDGRRRIASPGNAGQNTSWLATLPGPGQYWWSVQAVDAGFAGSMFAPEQAISIIAYGDIGAGLPGLQNPAVAWGDYDGDGDLDLILSGAVDGVTPVTYVYRNDGSGVFTLVSGGKAGNGLPDAAGGAMAWGDCDNDGDLDLALCGDTPGGPIAGVYRNDGGVYTDLDAALPGCAKGAVAWGDYDNDGDLDLYLSGVDAALYPVGGIHRNDTGGVFTPVAPAVQTVFSGSAAWGDYDNDGDLDLLLTGSTADHGCDTRLFRNDGADVFTDVATGIPGVKAGNGAWGDCDSDGDLDIVVGGECDGCSGSATARVYVNHGGSFTDLGAGLADLGAGRLAWGDYDNDGDPDVLLSGAIAPAGIATRLYRNDGGGAFTGIDLGFGATGAAAFGDYDGDGDLDLLVAGWTGSSYVVRIYGNEGAPANTPPTGPANLRQQQAGGILTLTWDAATDALTPVPGLSYNLRIGTTPGGGEVMAAMADPVTGRRRLLAPGNAQQRTSWSVRPPAGWQHLYCSVQAIDAAFAGSVFGTELEVSRDLSAVPAQPAAYLLHANAPNPFNPRTTLSFDLPAAGRVRLEIFDARGRRVRVLVDEVLPAGRHAAVWDGTDAGGRALASGVYLCRMEAAAYRRTVRMTLLK